MDELLHNGIETFIWNTRLLLQFKHNISNVITQK